MSDAIVLPSRPGIRSDPTSNAWLRSGFPSRVWQVAATALRETMGVRSG